MMFRTNRVDGGMTNGEVKTLVAMASEVQPTEVEAFIVLAFKHVSPHEHELIVSSNISDSVTAINRLLFLGMQTSATLEDTGRERTQDDCKSIRLCTHLGHRWFPFGRG